MTIIIETACRACGETFTLSSADIRRGVWRVCPPCRDDPERGDLPKDDTRARSEPCREDSPP